MEVEVPIEVGRPFIDRIDDYRTSPELSSPTHTTCESIKEQVTAQVVPLFAPFDGKAGEQQHWHRVGHFPPKARGRPIVLDGTHCERVETDDAPSPRNHVGSGGARGLGDSRAVIEPTVELEHARVELVDHMVLGQ